MPSLERRRRRRRLAVAVPVLALVGVAAFFVVGGIVKIGAGSSPYHRAVNGSFAAQATVITDGSNDSASELRSLLGSFGSAGLQRADLQHALDSLVAATQAQADAAQLAASPSPAAAAAEPFVAALQARALATTDLRRAVDGLLGMAPVDPVGSPSGPVATANRHPATPTLVAAPQATAEIARAGALVTRSDQQFAVARRLLGRAEGGTRPPASAWLRRIGPWSAGAAATWVADLAGSASLQPVHQVTLVAVRLDPAVLPSLTAAAPSVVPPTSHLDVTAVVANDGNVAETGVVVSATVGSGTVPASTSRTSVTVGAGSSVTVTLAPLRVKAGSSYQLTVSVVPSVAQADTSQLQQSVPVAVAPPTPPTTTTTTTTRPAPTTATTRPAPATTTTRRAPATTTTRPATTTTRGRT